MLACCLKCKINTENVDSKVLKTKSGRIVLLNIFIITICNSRKSRFMKEQ